jgi:hypothetical protein
VRPSVGKPTRLAHHLLFQDSKYKYIKRGKLQYLLFATDPGAAV